MLRGVVPIVLAGVCIAACGSSRPGTANPPRPSNALTTAARIPARSLPFPISLKAKPQPKAKSKPQAKPKPRHAPTTPKTTATATSTPAATTQSPTPTASSTSTPPPPAGAAVDIRNSLLGTILVDASGRTLYLFKGDRGSSSRCYGGCATVWPPVTTSGSPVPGSGVQASLLGSATRTDGKTQVTYDGHPLYYFAGDSSAGATNGQGIKQFGAKWWVVSPAGHAVKRR